MPGINFLLSIISTEMFADDSSSVGGSHWNCEISWASITPEQLRYCVVAIPRRFVIGCCCRRLVNNSRNLASMTSSAHAAFEDTLRSFGFAQFPSHFMSMWWTLHSERTMINFSMITSTVNGCDKLHFNWNFVAISIQSRARKKTFN